MVGELDASEQTPQITDVDTWLLFLLFFSSVLYKFKYSKLEIYHNKLIFDKFVLAKYNELCRCWRIGG